MHAHPFAWCNKAICQDKLSVLGFLPLCQSPPNVRVGKDTKTEARSPAAAQHEEEMYSGPWALYHRGRQTLSLRCPSLLTADNSPSVGVTKPSPEPGEIGPTDSCFCGSICLTPMDAGTRSVRTSLPSRVAARLRACRCIVEKTLSAVTLTAATILLGCPAVPARLQPRV